MSVESATAPTKAFCFFFSKKKALPYSAAAAGVSASIVA
jgi:hypothetical protein